MSAEGAIAIALEALYDAADDDSATGGPDLARRIFPVVAVSDQGGVRMIPEADIARLAGEVVSQRMSRPDGPLARIGTSGIEQVANP